MCSEAAIGFTGAYLLGIKHTPKSVCSYYIYWLHGRVQWMYITNCTAKYISFHPVVCTIYILI